MVADKNKSASLNENPRPKNFHRYGCVTLMSTDGKIGRGATQISAAKNKSAVLSGNLCPKNFYHYWGLKEAGR